MPAGRPPTEFSHLRGLLTELYQTQNIPQLRDFLLEEHGIKTSIRTIKRRFQEWGIQKEPPVKLSETLKNRIIILFFESGLEDAEMLVILQKEGWNIGKWTLVRLRRECGLRRRIGRTEEDRIEADIIVRRLLEKEIEKGVLEGFGREYLKTHFRQAGHVVATDRLFRIYKELSSEAIARQHRDLQFTEQSLHSNCTIPSLFDMGGSSKVL